MSVLCLFYVCFILELEYIHINQFISVLYVSEIHTTYELAGSLMWRNLPARLGDSGPPRRLHSETREGPSRAAA